MDGPTDYHTRRSKPDEKDEYHMICFICGIFKVIQINLYTKLKQTHRCRKLMVTKRGKKEKDILGG